MIYFQNVIGNCLQINISNSFTFICQILDVIANLLKLGFIDIQSQFLKAAVQTVCAHVLTYNELAFASDKLWSHRFVSCRVLDYSV